MLLESLNDWIHFFMYSLYAPHMFVMRWRFPALHVWFMFMGSTYWAEGRSSRETLSL